MIDFELKTVTQKKGGLNIGFSAGPYRKELSRAGAVYVTEEVFALLEPSILRHCPRYHNFGHWGITSLSRDEWRPIIDEWSDAERNVAQAATVDALSRALPLPDEIVGKISADFESNREGITRMLRVLVSWLRSELISSSEVCILGI